MKPYAQMTVRSLNVIETNDSRITTNEQYDRMVQPLDEHNLKQLEFEVVTDYSKRCIRVFRGNHLNDRQRYEACIRSGVEPRIEYMQFDENIKACIYICETQLKRNDLKPEYRKYLIGKRFNYEKLIKKDEKSGDPVTAIAAYIASGYYLASGTVIKYGNFAESMDVVFDQNSELALGILLGRFRISHENMIELSRLRPDEIKAVAKSAIKDKIERISISYIRNEVKWSYVQQRGPSSRREKKEEKLAEKPAIRQMPRYDPDSDVNSLCMTIDSWISSIQRVNNSENLSKISTKASLKLMHKLSFLEHAINSLQDSLVERTGI